MCASCGLSEITLDGVAADWLELIAKAKKLSEFGDDNLTNWSELLVPVLEEFYNLFMGKVDANFWQRICSYEEHGSGPSYFRGWFLVFAPFNMEGKYILRPKKDIMVDNIYAELPDSDIADTQLTVNVKVNDIDVTLFAGVLGTNYDSEQNMLSVTSDYVAIQHKDITFDIFQKVYHTAVYNPFYNSYRYSCYWLGTYDFICKFGYYLAIKSKIPNNLLTRFALDIHQATYMSDNDYTPTSGEIIDKIYAYNTKSYSEFAKYIDLKHNYVLVNNFWEEYNSTQKGYSCTII
jgi:hypothetical protein